MIDTHTEANIEARKDKRKAVNLEEYDKVIPEYPEIYAKIPFNVTRNSQIDQMIVTSSPGEKNSKNLFIKKKGRLFVYDLKYKNKMTKVNQNFNMDEKVFKIMSNGENFIATQEFNKKNKIPENINDKVEVP